MGRGAGTWALCPDIPGPGHRGPSSLPMKGGDVWFLAVVGAGVRRNRRVRWPRLPGHVAGPGTPAGTSSGTAVCGCPRFRDMYPASRDVWDGRTWRADSIRHPVHERRSPRRSPRSPAPGMSSTFDNETSRRWTTWANRHARSGHGLPQIMEEGWLRTGTGGARDGDGDATRAWHWRARDEGTRAGARESGPLPPPQRRAFSHDPRRYKIWASRLFGYG